MRLHQSFESSFRVYIEDTDSMGIVYHANYLKFFERARTDMLREQGFSLVELASQQVYFAIQNAQIEFLFPARLDDTITIQTQLVKQTLCSLLFEQSMQNVDNKRLSQLTVLVVCVNAHMKPQRLPWNGDSLHV